MARGLWTRLCDEHKSFFSDVECLMSCWQHHKKWKQKAVWEWELKETWNHKKIAKGKKEKGRQIAGTKFECKILRALLRIYVFSVCSLSCRMVTTVSLLLSLPFGFWSGWGDNVFGTDSRMWHSCWKLSIITFAVICLGIGRVQICCIGYQQSIIRPGAWVPGLFRAVSFFFLQVLPIYKKNKK